MEIVSAFIGILAVIGLGLAVRNRYWGRPKPTHEKTRYL
jgi:hypothetical protein